VSPGLSSILATRLHLRPPPTIFGQQETPKRGGAVAPIRVARVDERGPVVVSRGVYALRKLADERSRAREACRGAILQRRGEVESPVALARFTRDVDARRIALAGAEEAPEPAERRGWGRRR
jgi:hypothetical protein